MPGRPERDRTARRRGPSLRSEPVAALLPGLAAAVLIAIVATALGHLVPVVGAPVCAIVIGVVAATLRPPSPVLRPGMTFAAKRVLQASIVVLGLQLSVREVLTIGRSSLPVLVGSLVIVLGAAWLIGGALGLRDDVTTLIGVGTAICGASAIAATAAVITAAEADVAYAVATIFTFNVVAVLVYPGLGHAFGLSQHAFGLWAGTAINDTSSVVAASTVYGHGATAYAVTVKLVRTLAIVPICLGLAAWRNRVPRPVPAATGGLPLTGEARAAPARVPLGAIFPFFILAFVAAVVLNTAGGVPSGWHHGLTTLATWMITTALAAIGLSTKTAEIRTAGARPILLGAILWVLVGATSLALQAVTGTL